MKNIPKSGKLPIPMTNDYLFRALLQRNNKVLTGLISSLLHLSPKDIQSVGITNPIELGKSFNDKTFILDIKIILNDHTLLHLEMQVINQHNWPERSLSYLCREFDQLSSGEDYTQTKPIIQIGLLNFTLFPNAPEFYATYQLLNVKTFALYSDKLRLSVLDLTQIELATDEDKQYQIDYWASLFKAKTWEELNMLAKNNEYIEEAVKTVHTLSEEEMIKEQCRAREEYYQTINWYNKSLASQREEIDSQRKEIDSQRSELTLMHSELSAKEKQITSRNAELKTLRSELSAKDKLIADLQAQLKNKIE